MRSPKVELRTQFFNGYGGGLALSRDTPHATAATKAYREARAISEAPGVIMDELQKLDALAIADSTGILKPVPPLRARHELISKLSF